ncbi:MAG: neuraminidase-like domain-containing protein, partial [Actinomycetota bacterium]|nr:neuraminidase-like domain-containing protein [Actinomycetota bacterium]
DTAEGREVVATIGAWRPDDVHVAVARLGGAAPDALSTLHSVAEDAQLAADTGQTLAHLQAWAVADPDAALVQELAATVREALDPAAWRDSVQSVNDDLRNRRRDALVAQVVHHQPPPGVTTADELYEHLLVDVQMDACRQTSRIRQALSSVQLFVQRCLMNLEHEVSPDSIRSDRWQWTKRYRVDEANKRLFLWPENWMTEELRLDKSVFFRELEGDLLKADITPELAETAYLTYLKKLDDVSQLEIVGSHLEEHALSDDQDDVLHVLARSHGKNRTYWYRQFDWPSWSPWEKVALNIEGDIVLPVVWRGRLFAFWITALEKPQPGNQDDQSSPFAEQTWASPSRIDVELTVNWGERFQGEWVSPKSTSTGQPLLLSNLTSFDPDELLVFARTETPPGSNERLVLSVLYRRLFATPIGRTLTFTSKNAPPIVHLQVDPELCDLVNFYKDTFYDVHSLAATTAGNGLRSLTNSMRLRIGQPTGALHGHLDHTILSKPWGGLTARPVMHPVANQWNAPFFYSDQHSTFHVQPQETIRSGFVLVNDYAPMELVPVMDWESVWEMPEERLDPREPIGPIDPLDPVDPLERIVQPEVMVAISETMHNVLPGASSFVLDGHTFDRSSMERF